MCPGFYCGGGVSETISRNYVVSVFFRDGVFIQEGGTDASVTLSDIMLTDVRSEAEDNAFRSVKARFT